MGTPKKATTNGKRRPPKPETLLGYILDYTKSREISDDLSIVTLIDALREDIVAEALANR